MRNPPSAPCRPCQCQVCNSTSVKKTGRGLRDDPYKFESIIAPDEGNMYESGPTGQGVFAPDWLLNPPAVHVYATNYQTIKSETLQGLFFNEERFDTHSMHDNDSETSRLNIITPGIYRITLNLTWHKNDDGDRAIFIRRNGAEFLSDEAKHTGDADLYLGQSISIEEEFEAGQYVEAMCKQDSGKDLRVIAERYSPTFSAILMRPAL